LYPAGIEEVLMQVYQGRLWGVALGTLCVLWASLVLGAEFTATMLTRGGGMEIPGKVFVKGEKVRNEFQAASQTGIQIMRLDKKLVWVIMPKQKAYLEMPLTQEAQQKMFPLTENQKANLKKIGAETVNGYACDKYETTMSLQGKAMKLFVWIAPDLGMPVKMASQDGSLGMEYKDIQKGAVADSLFEPPQGYHKLKMPFALPQSH